MATKRVGALRLRLTLPVIQQRFIDPEISHRAADTNPGNEAKGLLLELLGVPSPGLGGKG